MINWRVSLFFFFSIKGMATKLKKLAISFFSIERMATKLKTLVIFFCTYLRNSHKVEDTLVVQATHEVQGRGNQLQGISDELIEACQGLLLILWLGKVPDLRTVLTPHLKKKIMFHRIWFSEKKLKFLLFFYSSCWFWENFINIFNLKTGLPLRSSNLGFVLDSPSKFRSLLHRYSP